MAKFVSYKYPNSYEKKDSYQSSSSPYGDKYPNPYDNKYKNPYGYWKSTPWDMPDRPFINYNDPTELNSFADIFSTLLNPSSLTRDFKWGGMSDIPILNIIPGMAEVLYKTTIRPIKENDWTALALNNLMSFTENIDILANPIKAVAQGYGWDGFKQAIGWDDDTPGRKNFDFDTGNLAADIFMEVIIDPLNWVTLGAKSAVTAGTKAGLRKAMTTALGDVAAKGVVDVAEAGAEKFIKKTVKEATEAVQNGIYKTFDEAIVKSIEFHASNDFAARYMATPEGMDALKQIGELLRKQALDDQSIRILESTSKLLAPAQAFEKNMLLGALNGTPVGATGYLLYKGIRGAKQLANNRMVNIAQSFFTPRNTLNILRAVDALDAMERGILPLNQALVKTGDDMDYKAIHESLLRESIRSNTAEVKKTLYSLRGGLFDEVHTVQENMYILRGNIRDIFLVDDAGADAILKYMKSNDRPPMALDTKFKEYYDRISHNAASLDKMLRDIRFAASRNSEMTSQMQRTLVDQKVRELHPEATTMVDLIRKLRDLAVDHPEMYERYHTYWVGVYKELRAEANFDRAFKRAMAKHYDDINYYTKNLSEDPIVPPAFIRQQKIMQRLAEKLMGEEGTKNLSRIDRVLDTVVRSEGFTKMSKSTQDLYTNTKHWVEATLYKLKFATPEEAMLEVNRRSVTEVPVAMDKVAKAKADLLSAEGQQDSIKSNVKAKAAHDKVKEASIALDNAETALKNLREEYATLLDRSPLKQGGPNNILQRLLDIETITQQEVHIEYLKAAIKEARDAQRVTIGANGEIPDEVAMLKLIKDTLTKTGEANAKFTKVPFDITKHFQEFTYKIQIPKGVNITTFNKNLINQIYLGNIAKAVPEEQVGKILTNKGDIIQRSTGDVVGKYTDTPANDIPIDHADVGVKGVVRDADSPTGYRDKLIQGDEITKGAPIKDPMYLEQTWSRYTDALKSFDDKNLKTVTVVKEYLIVLRSIKTSMEHTLRKIKEDKTTNAFLELPFTKDEFATHAYKMMDMIDELSDSLIHSPIGNMNMKSVWYTYKFDQQQGFETMLVESNVHEAMEAVLDEINMVDTTTKGIEEVAELTDAMTMIQSSVANSRDFVSEVYGRISEVVAPDVRVAFLNSIHSSARNKITSEMTDDDISNAVYHIIQDTETQLQTILQDRSYKQDLFYLDPEFLAQVEGTPHTGRGDTHALELITQREFPELIKEMEEKGIRPIYFDIETDGRPNGDVTELVLRASGSKGVDVNEVIQMPERPPSAELMEELYSENEFFIKAFKKNPKTTYEKVYAKYMKSTATHHDKAQYELIEDALAPMFSYKKKIGARIGGPGETGKVRFITWNGGDFDLPFLKKILDREEARLRIDLSPEKFLVEVTRINAMRSLLQSKNVSHVDAMELYKKKLGAAEISREQKHVLSALTQKLFYRQKALVSGDSNFELDLLQLPDSKLLNLIDNVKGAFEKYELEHDGFRVSAPLLKNLSTLAYELRSVYLGIKNSNRAMAHQYVIAKRGAQYDDAILATRSAIYEPININQIYRSYVDADGVKHLNPAPLYGIKKNYDPIMVSRIAVDDIQNILRIVDDKQYIITFGKVINIVGRTADSIANTALFKRNPFTPEINELVANMIKAHPYLKHVKLNKDTLVDYATARFLLKSSMGEQFRAALDLLTDADSKAVVKLLLDFKNSRKLVFSENELNFRARQMDEFNKEFNKFHNEERPVDEFDVDQIYKLIDSVSVNTPQVDLVKIIDAVEDVYARQADFMNVLHQAANVASLGEAARALYDKRAALLKPSYMLGRKIAKDVRAFIKGDGSVDAEGFQKYMSYHKAVQHAMARQQMKIVLSFDEDTLAWALLRSKRMMKICILGFEQDMDVVDMFVAFQKKLTPEFTARTGIEFESNMVTVTEDIVNQHTIPDVIAKTPEVYNEIANLVTGKQYKNWDEIKEGLIEIRNRLHEEADIEVTDASKALRATKEKIDSCLFEASKSVRKLGDPKVLEDFLNSHLIKLYNSKFNNPKKVFIGDEIRLVLSRVRPDSSVVPTTLPRLNMAQALKESKLTGNLELSKLYMDVHAQQEILVGDKIDFSMGEIANPSLYEDYYNTFSDRLRQALPESDELLHHTRMDASDTFTSSIGSAKYRRIFQQGYPGSMAQGLINSAKYHAMTVDAVVGYMQLFFDEMHSINTGLLSKMDDIEIVKALKAAPEQRLVALIKDPKSKTGARVVELMIRNEADLAAARKLNPVFMHYQTYSKAFQTINDFHFDNMWLRTVQKFTYLSKMGYLMTGGAVFRNAVDAFVKNAIVTESPLEMMAFYGRALRDEGRYNTALKDIISHSKYNRIQLQSIDWYFSSANPQPSKMTREEFSRIHIFHQDGPAAGQAAEMNKAYQESFNQTYKGWGDKLKEAREKGDELSIDYYKQMIASKDRTVEHELWQTANIGVEFMLQPTQKVESIARYAEYLWALEKGGRSQSEAYTMVAKTHFEYGLKNPSEYIAELVIPFYTFTMRNLEFWIDVMSNNPRLFSMMGDTMRPIWNFDSIPQEELENNRSLQYSLLQGNIEFEDTNMTLKLNPSYMDVYNLLTQPPLRTDEGTIDGSMWNRVNAGLKYPITAMLLAMQDQEAQTNLQMAAAYLPAIGPLAQRIGEQIPRYSERLEGHPISQALSQIAPSVFGANMRWQPRSPKKKSSGKKYSSYSGAGKAYSKSGRRSYFKKYYPNQKAGRYESFFKKHYSKKGNSKQSMRMTKLTPKMLQFRLKDMFYYYR